MSFTVAIVGRPNVGKSTLFNRLIGSRTAIVDNISGVTRDRNYGTCEWLDKSFNVIDTGGWVPKSNDVFEKAIREQVHIAIEEASLIIYMVDVTTGITDLDDSVAQILRKSDKKVLCVVNKVDNGSRLLEANEFYSLGFSQLFFVASISGSGTGDLLDAVVENMPEEVEEEEDSETPKFAILGQPNVGKSSFVNALIGEPRNIVTDIAGTTRDVIHSHYNLFNKEFILIDTAGIRKKAKVHENLEFYSVIRAIRSIDEADVCFLLIDAHTGVEAQDLAILKLIEKKKKAVVICVNKWDAVEKETNTIKEMTKEVLGRTAPFTDIPVIFMSALDKTRIMKAIETGIKVFNNRDTRISTSVLNDWLADVLDKHHPPSYRGKYIKIKYVTQLPTRVPSFAFFSNYPREIKEPFKNFLENQLRERFDLSGIPINVFFRQK